MVYQPLTPEQFKSAQKAGFSTQKIIEMEQKRKVESTSTPEVSQVTPPQEEIGGIKGFVKSIVSAPLTIAARPLQLGARVLGASEEDVDKFSKEKLGGFVAPLPKSGSDVLKDVGRGIETVSLGLGGGVVKDAAGNIIKQTAKQALKQGIKEGAIAGGTYGFGSSLERKGSDVTAGDIIKDTAIGAGTGAAVPIAFAGAGKVINKVRGGLASRATQQADELALLKGGKLPPDGGGSAGGAIPDARVATKTLSPEGKVVTDKVAKEAVRQGIPEADVALIKTGNATDKAKMARMLDIRQSQLTNKRVTDRATDVVGDTFVERIAKPLATKNKQAAQQLNEVAKGLAGKKVNPTEAIVSFSSDLENAGIKVSKGGKLNFKGSDFEGIPSAQNAIQNVWSRALRIAKNGDALQLHRAKSYIDEIVSYGKSAEGLSGRAERILKGFRHNADAVLDTKFPAYNKVNTVFAETIGELDKISQAMGRKFRIGDNFADARAGVTLRRILSNTQSRADILQLLESAQKVAQKHGAKIDEDIITQANFADILEKMLGSEAPTSFLGQVERGMVNAEQAVSAGADLAQGNLIRGTIKAGKYAIDVTRGINQENKINALKELLKYTDDVAKKSNFGTKK